MLQFFKNRGYPDSVVKTAQERAQTTNQQSAPQTSQKGREYRSHSFFTHSPVKNIILKNFKLLQNDNETSRIFSLPPLILFKRNKNISDFLVRSTLKSDASPGTINCTCKRCKTCPFIHNTDEVTGPKRSITITDRFTCTSTNVMYCIKCTLCKKIYIGETGRRIGDRFREHLRDVECNDEDASKPVVRHFNLPNHSTQNMTICGLSMHQGNTESRKNQEQKFIFQLGSLNPHGINERFSFV